MTDGMYTINPDVTGSEAPVSVRCQMSPTSTKALTAVSHDREVNTSYARWNQYETGCSYKVPIHYALPQSQITSMMNNSSECHMDINVYCLHMRVTGYACYKGVNGADRPLVDIIGPGKSSPYIPCIDRVKGCTHRVMILCDGAVDSPRKEQSKAIAQWEFRAIDELEIY